MHLTNVGPFLANLGFIVCTRQWDEPKSVKDGVGWGVGAGGCPEKKDGIKA